MLNGEEDIIKQHLGMPKGDEEVGGVAKGSRDGKTGVLEKKKGKDCVRDNKLNDRWIATMI